MPPHRELRRRVATGELQIPMNLTIGMRSNTGALATVAMSFNNHATISVDFRLIGEENTYLIAGGSLAALLTQLQHEGHHPPLTRWHISM